MEDSLRCRGCMNERTDQMFCSYCGYNHETQPDSQIYIKPGTVINNYVFGKVLGHGGFGITYIGYDNANNRKVAIKEYLPSELATRNGESLQVTIFTGEKAETFRAGIDKFKREAETIQQFSDFPGIVDGFEVFEANHTAYFVMEYIEGVTLKDYIAQKGGKLPFNTVRAILLPIMDALSEMHRKDIMHRDISPDNIYITQDKQVKLLDFGAARQAIGEHNKSLSVVLKHGFTPKEQYFSKGNQGPWTDVYALGATAYYMLTGKVPQPALDRLEQDKLLPISSFIYDINPSIDAIFAKVLAIDEQNRFQTIDIFKDAITNFDANARPYTQSQTPQVANQFQTSAGALPPVMPQVQSQSNTPPVNQQKGKKKNNGALIAALIAIPIVAVCLIAIMLTVIIPKTPDLYKMTSEEAISLLEDKGFDYDIEYDTHEKISAGDVAKQDPKAKKLTFKKHVTFVVSQGPKEVTVPDVVSQSQELASATLEKYGFDLNIESTYSLDKEGTVMSLSPEPGTQVKNGSDIKVMVSKGLNPDWVVFEDDNLEKAIVKELGLNVDLTKEKISKGMVSRETSLYLYDENIKSLKGIDAFEKLEALSCTNGQLTSVPSLPLSIQMLDLSTNNLKDVDLSKYTNLYDVNLSGNQLTVIPKLPIGLEYLDLYDNQIKDISGIDSFANLSILDVSYNQISDFTPLDPIYSYLAYCYTEGNPGSTEIASSGGWEFDLIPTYRESYEIPTLYPEEDGTYKGFLLYNLKELSAAEGINYYGESIGEDKVFSIYTYEEEGITIYFYMDPSSGKCEIATISGYELPIFGEYDIWSEMDTYSTVLDYFGQPYDYAYADNKIYMYYVTNDLVYCFGCNETDGVIAFLRVIDKDYFLE